MEARVVRMRRTLKMSWRRNRQSGVALYLMLIVSILVSVQLMSAQLSAQKHHNNIERQQRLKFARENLKALAVNYMDNYGPGGAGSGHLPCPNLKLPDGSRSSFGPDAPCNAEHFAIGRLPLLVGIEYNQRVLNYQPDQYDAQNALWYIVSSNFVNSPFRKVNSETPVNFSFNGVNDVVAVVLDSGQALERQRGSRPSSKIDSYLELKVNAAEIKTLTDSNDRFLILTRGDVMPLVSTRVSGRVAKWLIEYRNRLCPSGFALMPCYPFAAALSDGECSNGLLEGWLSVGRGSCSDSLIEGDSMEGVPTRRHWFMRNRWFEQVRYSVDASCLESPNTCQVLFSTKEYGAWLRPSLSIVPLPRTEP